jgi:hypothetical protein
VLTLQLSTEFSCRSRNRTEPPAHPIIFSMVAGDTVRSRLSMRESIWNTRLAEAESDPAYLLKFAVGWTYAAQRNLQALDGKGPVRRRAARGAQNAIAIRLTQALRRHAAQPSLGLPHHSAPYQAALSTPIGDGNRSRLVGLRLASDDRHRDGALRT